MVQFCPLSKMDIYCLFIQDLLLWNITIINRPCLTMPFLHRQFRNPYSGRLVQVQVKPYMVNPLSVSEKHEKKRLILDLSFINNFWEERTVKIWRFKIPKQYFEKDCFMTKFDLQSGYHHLDINPMHMTMTRYSNRAMVRFGALQISIYVPGVKWHIVEVVLKT